MLRIPFLNKLNGGSILILGVLLSVSSFLFSGCMEDDSNLDELMRQQEEAYKKQLGTDTLAIKKYLADNNITNAKRTNSGLFYVLEPQPTGTVQPQANNTVRVHYKLTDLTGKEFDSSKGKAPLKFKISPEKNPTAVIYGFEEAVLLLKVDGKGKFYLPSGIAYNTSGKGNIPPNTILIFDLELVAVGDE